MTRGAACGLTALMVFACQRSPDITGVRIVVDFAGPAEQLELSIVPAAGGAALLPPTRRPASPGAVLPSPADVVVYLPDEQAGNDVVCRVRPVHEGTAYGGAETTVRMQLHSIVVARLTISGDAGGIDWLAPSDGAARPGEPCTAASDCASSFCVDGVCCDSPCSGGCLACNLPGSTGICSAVPAGEASPECPDEGAASCGRDGTCDGNGGCRLYRSGTGCRPASCAYSSGEFDPGHACNGLGSCLVTALVSCGPYRCDGNGCVGSCAGDADCTFGSCVAGRCSSATPKPLGQPCTLGAQCASGICSDGVCCSTDCSGQACRRCDAAGACAPVAAGSPDPHGACTKSAASSCGLDGSCDGKGACRFWPAGTFCDSGGGVCGTTGQTRSMLYQRFCDGTGAACPAAATATECAPYGCVSSPSGAACGTSCSLPMDCAPGVTCIDGTCVPNDAGVKG